jgi:hypothetical protein
MLFVTTKPEALAAAARRLAGITPTQLPLDHSR